MRAALLIVPLLWSWLAASAGAGTQVLPGASDGKVQPVAGHDDAALVGRVRSSQLTRSLDASRPRSGPGLALHLVLPAAPGRAPARAAASAAMLARPVDLARARWVATRPIEPRAPPPARR